MSSGLVVAIGGVAGSGKSTLGRALAEALGAPMLDLDSVTTPLLDALPEEAWGGRHWLKSTYANDIRRGRYDALTATARDVAASAGTAVLVAPFTKELQGGVAAAAIEDAVAPARLVMVELVGDEETFARRRAARGEVRDEHRPPSAGRTVPHESTIVLDADLDTHQQLARLLPQLGIRASLDAAAPLFGETFDAMLFDLDGTLVDSTGSVIRAWRRFAEHYAVPMAALHANHGQPARVLIGNVLPADRFDEAFAKITDLEVGDADGLRPVLGALELFDSIPEERRAIVTSGSVAIASARLAAAGIRRPATWVTVEDVTRGKPDPEPFLTAATRLGVDPTRCLVVEDAAAGITSAKAAGCRVLAVMGTSIPGELTNADLVVDGLDQVSVEVTAEGLRLLPGR